MKSSIIPESQIDSLTSLSEAKDLLRAQNRIIIKLESEVNDLKVTVSDLNKRIDSLEEKLAQQSKTSINSSKPPSSDITKPKKELRIPGRKKGGQPGHKGVKRELVPAEQVDQIITVNPSECAHCGSLKLVNSGDEKIEQRFELVEKPILVTQYHLQSCYCLNCNQESIARLPEGEVIDSPFGIRLQALVSFIKVRAGASYTEIQEILDDCLGVNISTGALTEIVMRTSKSLEPSYTELAGSIKEEPCVYIDETSWKDNGVMFWLWVFCSSTIAFFTLDRSRGRKVIEEILGESYTGGIVSDFFSAYVSYGCLVQQFCLAHLIRDLKYCKMVKGRGNPEFAERVLDFLKAMFSLWHSRDELTERQFVLRFNQLKSQLHEYLKASRPCHKLSINLKARMLKHFDKLFTFATRVREGQIEPTNNRSERTIRGAVRIRRATQGTRGTRGQQWIERSMTVLETCKLQKRSTFRFFCDSLNTLYFGGNYPSLIPVK